MPSKPDADEGLSLDVEDMPADDYAPEDDLGAPEPEDDDEN